MARVNYAMVVADQLKLNVIPDELAKNPRVAPLLDELAKSVRRAWLMSSSGGRASNMVTRTEFKMRHGVPPAPLRLVAMKEGDTGRPAEHAAFPNTVAPGLRYSEFGRDSEYNRAPIMRRPCR